MNVRNKKIAIYGGRNNWKAAHNLHTKSFSFKKENTYIYTNVNARALNIIAVEDSVKGARCYKVEAKEYELFKGQWFVTHTNGDVYYLNDIQYTMDWYKKFGWDAWYRLGNDVKWKAPKVVDYLVPHLCFGWSILSKAYLDYLRKEIDEDRKEDWYLSDSSMATEELEVVEAFIKEKGLVIT